MTIQVVLGSTLVEQLVDHLRAFVKFASSLQISIKPSSDLMFSVVNENGSCYCSLKLSGMRLDRQITTEIDPNDQIFRQSYRQPLKSLLHHLNNLRIPDREGLILQFSRYSLEIRTVETESFEGSDTLQSTWRSLLEPITIENPVYPPLQSFPVSICGLSPDWFHFLLDAAGSNNLLTKSTLILHCQAGNNNGLKLILPGSNRAEIDVGSFTFTSIRCDAAHSVMVSLREMSALMNLARKLNSLVDFYFGPAGQYPLVSIISSIGAFECKFVMATIPSSENIVEQVEQEEVDHISGTEDELEEE